MHLWNCGSSWTYGTNHKQQILKALEEKGYQPKVVDTKLY